MFEDLEFDSEFTSVESTAKQLDKMRKADQDTVDIDNFFESLEVADALGDDSHVRVPGSDRRVVDHPPSFPIDFFVNFV